MMKPETEHRLHRVKCYNKVGATRSIYHVFVVRGCVYCSTMHIAKETNVTNHGVCTAEVIFKEALQHLS